jgi:hypothetical protein
VEFNSLVANRGLVEDNRSVMGGVQGGYGVELK